jgi:hypothetical protein
MEKVLIMKQVVTIQEDENGELILPLGEGVCEELGWKEGDTLDWKDNGDGSWTITKKETEYVLVDCVSTFRMRYLVEVPKGKAEWALDTVTMQEAKEFSQEYLGEQIVSHRVVSKEEALAISDVDNAYGSTWAEELKIKNFFTSIGEDKDEDL